VEGVDTVRVVLGKVPVVAESRIPVAAGAVAKRIQHWRRYAATV
jgi:hypothetical protein